MKQGDVFVSSWGYEQTNVDFYEVVKVAAKTVTLIPIERKVQLKGFMRYTAMPIPGSGTAFPMDGNCENDYFKTVRDQQCLSSQGSTVSSSKCTFWRGNTIRLTSMPSMANMSAS